MTDTASRIPPETKGIICDTPVIRCWRYFLVLHQFVHLFCSLGAGRAVVTVLISSTLKKGRA